MIASNVMGRSRVCMAVCALASVTCCFSGGAIAAMTPEQMKSLKGAAQLEITVDQLFRRCGLAEAIVNHGSAVNAKQGINWRGVAMRLSATDWDAVYGTGQRKPGTAEGWFNQGKADVRCTSGLTRLLFHANGNVGFVTVTKKTQGFGYITTYQVPKDLFKAHKVVGAEVTLKRSIPVSTLAGCYGQPDEVIKQPGANENFRYWVVTLRGQKPESLYAVDFEIENSASKTYVIRTSGVDFVQRRLELLVREWERDYVND